MEISQNFSESESTTKTCNCEDFVSGTVYPIWLGTGSR